MEKARAGGPGSDIMVSQQRDVETIHAELTEWIRAKLPSAGEVTLSSLTRPGLGFSNETLIGDLTWREEGEERSESLVFRLQPKDFLVFPEYDLPKQVRVMQCLAKTNVPVPAIRWLEEDEGVVGCPFYVMPKIEGDIPQDVPPYHTSGIFLDATPERRAKMWWNGLQALAGIHTADWEGLGLSFLGVPKGGTGPLDQQLDYYESFLDWAREGGPEIILDAALRWLRENRFAPPRVTLCWGDSRLPNLIFRDDEVVGVLDWEMAFLGPPEADLAWWFFLDWHHSEGNGNERLEGFPSREETIQRYEELTGWKTENLHYHEVMAAFRFGVIMVSFYQNLKQRGMGAPRTDLGLNNPATRRLASLLDLPSPGEAPQASPKADERTVRVQFRLTGAGGRDWYLVAQGGQGTRHDGTVENPDVTLTATAADWEAIQRGEMSRAQAQVRGKIAIEGDATLLMPLDEMISRLSDQGSA